MKYLRRFNEAKVTIREASKKRPKYTNKYVAKIKYMYGDADGYGTNKYDFDKPEELAEFALFCEMCLNTYPSGRGDESYDIVPGWDEMKKKYGFRPHYCPEAYGDGEASWDEVEYYYYDENGNKSEVDIEFTPEEKKKIEDQKKISWEDYRKFQIIKKASHPSNR